MAIASPILRKVTTSASTAKKRISDTRSSFKTIGQILFKKTKVKREAYVQTNLFRKRREETERRQQLESELESPNIVSKPGGAQQLIQNTGVGGFFDRILGFIGYLAAGWIMNNLPTWIAMGKEFIARIQKAGEILSGFFNNTLKLFVGVGNVLGALGQNLLQFDFFDTSNRIKNSMVDLNNTMGALTGQIEEAFGLVTTPLTQGKYSGQDIPGVGTQYQDEGAYAEPSPYGGGVGGIHRQALDIIAGPESGGNYNAMNQGTDARGRIIGSGDSNKIIGKPLTSMTIGEVMDRQNQSKYPRSARPDRGIHAAGKYQIIGMTLPGAVKSAGLKPTDMFSPENQDKLGLAVLKSQGVGAWTAGGSRYSAKERAIIKEAQRTPLPTSPLSQVASNKPSNSSVGLKSIGGGHQLATGAADAFLKMKSAAAAQGINLTLSSSYRSYEKQAYLYKLYKEGKGNLAAPPGTSKHEKGLAIDVANGIPWVQANARKFGWKATVAGESWHFEYLGGGGIPAQFSAASQQRMSYPEGITPERKGQDIMIAQAPDQQNIITSASGGGDAPSSSPINDFQLLNNFIKNKLLLDLAYL